MLAATILDSIRLITNTRKGHFVDRLTRLIFALTAGLALVGANPTASADQLQDKQSKEATKADSEKKASESKNAQKATKSKSPSKKELMLQKQKEAAAKKAASEAAKEAARVRGRARRAAQAKAQQSNVKTPTATTKAKRSAKGKRASADLLQKMAGSAPSGDGTCSGESNGNTCGGDTCAGDTCSDKKGGKDGDNWQSTCKDKGSSDLKKIRTAGSGKGIPKLKVKQSRVVNNDFWRGDMIECFWEIRNSGDAPLRIRAKGG